LHQFRLLNVYILDDTIAVREIAIDWFWACDHELLSIGIGSFTPAQILKMAAQFYS